MEKKFDSPEYYGNRELSWLQFNERILGEARDKTIPLFERLKFLSITASNLDEFFMIRVASLRDMVHAGYEKPDVAGMTPQQQLQSINQAAHKFVSRQCAVYMRSFLPQLAHNGLHVIHRHEDLKKEQKKYVDRYFIENVYPVLTPMAVDSSRPFPLIRNKSLNIGALVKKKETREELEFATVQVPGMLPRIVPLPDNNDGEKVVILLEEIIERNMNQLFLSYDVVNAHPYRIMRNADLSIEEDEASDLLKEVEKVLKKRKWGEVIRLEVEDEMDERLLHVLEKALHVHQEDVYKINGPIDLTFLMKMYGLCGFKTLKNPRYVPRPVPEFYDSEEDVFTTIRNGDILIHHPYQSFQPVIDFVKQAAIDPNVLAIKQTLYRVSGNSPIITALAQAAENGKQVTVLVELKARFDEENNIVWAKKLEKSGCHVIYGLVGLKTHSKITLVVRGEEDGIRRYVHLGTGNYNDSTAKLYTDMGLFTCSAPIGEDATAVFNMLSGYSEPLHWNKLTLAPLWLRDKFIRLIRREENNAKQGKEGRIMAKMNSLCDKGIIEALYKASAAGVKIELVVRGICSLKTGIPGVSDNITVHSIVGNFLEHSRIYCFYNNGVEEVYMSSADWMPRNLDKRVEILFPVEDERLKEKVMRVLEIQLSDNVKAYYMKKDGTYEKYVTRGKPLMNSQKYFMEEADDGNKRKKDEKSRLFIPAEPLEVN